MTPLFTNEREIPPVKVWLAVLQGFGWLALVGGFMLPFILMSVEV